MAWIEFHSELRDHWKIRRLAELMEVKYNEALGTMACLWLWCIHYAPDGDVTRFNDTELRHAANTDHEKFSADALKRCELINDRNKINDWNDHGIKYLKSARLRTKRYRDRLRHRNVTVTSTLPDHTIPNHTIPKQHRSDVGFDAFWKTYPRKVAKHKAWQLWLKLSPEPALAAQIVRAIELQKKSLDWIKEDGKYIPHPSTWLNQKRWEDEINSQVDKTPFTEEQRAQAEANYNHLIEREITRVEEKMRMVSK